MATTRSTTRWVFSALFALLATRASALEPPTAEQIDNYLRDGSFVRRSAAASTIGNQRISPRLAQRFAGASIQGEKHHALKGGLQPTGAHRVFALLIDFSNYPGHNHPGAIDWRLFGDGPSTEFPYESLRDYYRRSSYGQLEIEGVTLGWYSTRYSRAQVDQTTSGREALIREAVTHFDDEGHDFSQYDNDGDGAIDYFLVIWAGPHQEWADFWWGYQRSYENVGFTVDGVRLGEYSWQWESWDYPGPFSAQVAIHETGHALGLPDYYDYDDSVGPRGGLGGLDMMDNNWGDHNAFSKFLLGWISPEVINKGDHDLSLSPADAAPEAVLLMHGDPVTTPFDEYFIVQSRRRRGNDVGYPQDGLLIWHVDARVSAQGGFLNDNSYTDHKLLRLMEADGLEEIERNQGADAGDFYRAGDSLTSTTIPNSNRYDGAPTNLVVDSIVRRADTVSLRADLGTGCAVFCESEVARTSWVGRRVFFDGGAVFEQCGGTAPGSWDFGDGSEEAPNPVGHVFEDPGIFDWSFDAHFGDAKCALTGEILVCRDPRCWQWKPGEPMLGARVMHAAAVLDDGRVLVTGGQNPAEIYDPVRGAWDIAGQTSATFEFAQSIVLNDGRVLVVGSTRFDQWNTEIFDPETGFWRITGQLLNPRRFHSAIRLADGRVLVAGGHFYDQEGGHRDVLQAEVFDPQSETWSEVGSIGEAVLLPGLTLLSNGRVLLTADRSVRIFDPVAETWVRTSDMEFEHGYQFAAGLPDGRVLVGGGFVTRNVEIYDPVTVNWTMTGAMNDFRLAPSVTVDASGKVFVFGGFDRFSNVVQTAEMYDPEDGRWTRIASMDRARLAHTASLLFDGSVLITGGMQSLAEEPYQGSTAVELFVPPGREDGPRQSDDRQ